MALQETGSISLQDIATEFDGTTPHSISEYYGAATGVPASGAISISDFYGVSSSITKTLQFFDQFYAGGQVGAYGTMNVYVVDTSGNILDGPVYTVTETTASSAWVSRQVNYTIPAQDHKIVFRYDPNSVADFSLDNVRIDGTVVGDNFHNEGWVTTSGINTSDLPTALSNVVGVPYNTSAAVLGRWNTLDGAATPTGGTGPTGLQTGSIYVYAEGNSNSTMWLFSPTITV